MHPILHVVVIGFHHKKGNQVEFCYPPLKDNVVPDSDKDIPEQWQNLPSLALPDGAHNVEEDTIFFILPSLEKPNHAVFGLSCYRQMSSNDLVNKEVDVTRSSVQKSVCVLSKIPLYGPLKAKLEVITQSYFNEKDFSKVEVLHQMYSNLCDLFSMDFIENHSAAMGISLSPLINTFKHRVILLFKLLLLERRVVFDIFPVHLLGDIMIGLASLFPSLLDDGLYEAADYSVRRLPASGKAEVEDVAVEVSNAVVQKAAETADIKQSSKTLLSDVEKVLNNIIMHDSEHNNAFEEGEEAVNISEVQSERNNPSSFDTDDFGFPLSIFTKGSLFHPYLSISYLDMIQSETTRAYCIGVTNAIFKTKRDMSDVIITLDEKGEGQIEILSPELKRQLALTTQDLRFADFMLKMRELNTDSTHWNGSDDWVRTQFHDYLVAMLAVASTEQCDATSEYNDEFIKAYKSKHNYRVWSSCEHPGMKDVKPAHPFAGQLSVNDVFLKMGVTLNSSEQGRRMISTITNTGKYVSETGSRFKSSISSWVRSTASRLQPEFNASTNTDTTPTTASPAETKFSDTDIQNT